MVDGAARPATVVTLSHWPASPTPPALWRDLSAEIAFAYLDAPEHWRDAEAVSIDHLDADGLVSLFALVEPQAAERRRELLVTVARAGDFDVVESLDAGRVAFALEALCDLAGSPLGGGTPAAGGDAAGSDRWSSRVESILDLLPSLCDAPARSRALYEGEEAALRASNAAFAADAAELTELPEVGLAVVRLRRPVAGAGRRVGDGAITIGLHPAAIHARSAQPRVLLLEQQRATFYDRYETWVRFVSKRLPLRVDMQPLAGTLNAREPAGAPWSADPPNRTRPVLSCPQGSGVTEHELVRVVGSYLASAPPAWDPFAQAPFSAAAASRSGTSGRGRLRWGGRRTARP
jgi:hypothetical protein